MFLGFVHDFGIPALVYQDTRIILGWRYVGHLFRELIIYKARAGLRMLDFTVQDARGLGFRIYNLRFYLWYPRDNQDLVVDTLEIPPKIPER